MVTLHELRPRTSATPASTVSTVRGMAVTNSPPIRRYSCFYVRRPRHPERCRARTPRSQEFGEHGGGTGGAVGCNGVIVDAAANFGGDRGGDLLRAGGVVVHVPAGAVAL